MAQMSGTGRGLGRTPHLGPLGPQEAQTTTGTKMYEAARTR